MKPFRPVGSWFPKALQLTNISLQSVNIWDKVFKNGPSEICGRRPLRNLKGYGLLKQMWYVCYLLSQKFDVVKAKVRFSNFNTNVRETPERKVI